VALAAIGVSAYTRPLLSRGVVIHMTMRPPDERNEPFIEYDPKFVATRAVIEQWAKECLLDQDPEMPPGFSNRDADNWRVLFAIANNLGAGADARAAAIELKSNRVDVDPGVALLRDIRAIFDERGEDRIWSAVLVKALLALNDYWYSWVDERHREIKLTRTHLGRLLGRFQIHSKTIWLGHGADRKSSKGYTRDQFEKAWREFCPPDGTAAQSNKTMRLVGR